MHAGPTSKGVKMFNYLITATVLRKCPHTGVEDAETIVDFIVQAPGISHARTMMLTILGGEPVHWQVKKV